jgi:hypothetical protein
MRHALIASNVNASDDGIVDGREKQMDISLVHITKIERKLQSQSEFTKVQLIGSTHKPSNDPPAQLDDPNDSLYQLQKRNDDLVEKIVLLTYKMDNFSLNVKD